MNTRRRRMIRSWKRTRSTLRVGSVVAGMILIAGGIYAVVGTGNPSGVIGGAVIIIVGISVIGEVIVYERRDKEAERARRECQRRH